LKNPHPNLLPEGEGTALARNRRETPSASLFSLSLPLGETHAQAAVRAKESLWERIEVTAVSQQPADEKKFIRHKQIRELAASQK
jgi:hypothetical protein